MPTPTNTNNYVPTQDSRTADTAFYSLTKDAIIALNNEIVTTMKKLTSELKALKDEGSAQTIKDNILKKFHGDAKE